MLQTAIVLQVPVKEEEGSTAEAQQTEGPAMLEAGSSAPTLPNGDAHMAEALDASCAPAEVGSPAGAAPTPKLEAEPEQKPEMFLLDNIPVVKVICCLCGLCGTAVEPSCLSASPLDIFALLLWPHSTVDFSRPQGEAHCSNAH